jgi:hypothetical protein
VGGGADWLRQFTQETLALLVALNRDLVTEALARLELPAWRSTWMGRSSGPAPRSAGPSAASTRITGRNPSYYPLVAHVAQTGHILRLHDSKQAVPFLCELIDDLRGRFGRPVALEFRMDAAFFQRGILHLLAARECGTRSRSAIGVGPAPIP